MESDAKNNYLLSCANKSIKSQIAAMQLEELFVTTAVVDYLGDIGDGADTILLEDILQRLDAVNDQINMISLQIAVEELELLANAVVIKEIDPKMVEIEQEDIRVVGKEEVNRPQLHIVNEISQNQVHITACLWCLMMSVGEENWFLR